MRCDAKECMAGRTMCGLLGKVAIPLRQTAVPREANRAVSPSMLAEWMRKNRHNEPREMRDEVIKLHASMLVLKSQAQTRKKVRFES